jgi:hypothetical protein
MSDMDGPEICLVLGYDTSNVLDLCASSIPLTTCCAEMALSKLAVLSLAQAYMPHAPFTTSQAEEITHSAGR